MNFDPDIFNNYMAVMVTGISAGFSLGFISWAIGFGIYGMIKFIKQA